MSVRTASNTHYYPSAYLSAHHHQEQGWHSPSSIPPPTSPRWTCVGLPPEDAPCPGCALDTLDHQLGFGTPAHGQPTFSEPRSLPRPPHTRYGVNYGSTSPDSAAPLSPLDVPTSVSSWTPIPTTPSKSSYTSDPRSAGMRMCSTPPSSSNRNTPHFATPRSGQLGSPTTHICSWSGSTLRVPNTNHVTGVPTPKSVPQVKNIPMSFAPRQAINQSSNRTAQTASNGKRSQEPGRNDTIARVPSKALAPTAGMHAVQSMPRSHDGGSTRIQRVDRSLYPVTSSLRCSERAPVPVLMFLP